MLRERGQLIGREARYEPAQSGQVRGGGRTAALGGDLVRAPGLPEQPAQIAGGHGSTPSVDGDPVGDQVVAHLLLRPDDEDPAAAAAHQEPGVGPHLGPGVLGMAGCRDPQVLPGEEGGVVLQHGGVGLSAPDVVHQRPEHHVLDMIGTTACLLIGDALGDRHERGRRRDLEDRYRRPAGRHDQPRRHPIAPGPRAESDGRNTRPGRRADERRRVLGRRPRHPRGQQHLPAAQIGLDVQELGGQDDPHRSPGPLLSGRADQAQILPGQDLLHARPEARLRGLRVIGACGGRAVCGGHVSTLGPGCFPVVAQACRHRHSSTARRVLADRGCFRPGVGAARIPSVPR